MGATSKQYVQTFPEHIHSFLNFFMQKYLYKYLYKYEEAVIVVII
jgi:hypothetical protein